MDIRDRERYAIPVYTFDPDEWSDEPNPPETDTEHHLLLTRQERQTGPQHIVVTEKQGGNRITSYDFRITNIERQWCAYTGNQDDDVPIAVLHAVHEYGYGVQNVVTLGQTVTDRWENQLLFAALRKEKQSNENPLLTGILQNLLHYLDLIDTILVVKYGTSDGKYEELWSEFHQTTSISDPNDSIDINEAKSFFWDAAHDHGVAHMFGSENGDSILLGVSTQSIETQDGSIIAVDLATDFGIERFLFHETSSDTCAYIEDGQSSRPNPRVVSLLQDEGYTVTNTRTTTTATTVAEQLEYGGIYLEDLLNRTVYFPADAHTFKPFIEAVFNYLRTAHILALVREQTTEEFDSFTGRVLEHVGLSDDDMSKISIQQKFELGSAVMELIDDDVIDWVVSEMDSSPIHGEDADGEAREKLIYR